MNCGCFTRQAASYADYDPCVWLWYGETNTVKKHYLKVDDNVVSRDHLEKLEEREKRISAFVERLSNDWEVSVSFEENLSRFISENRLRKEVIELIYKASGNED